MWIETRHIGSLLIKDFKTGPISLCASPRHAQILLGDLGFVFVDGTIKLFAKNHLTTRTNKPCPAALPNISVAKQFRSFSRVLTRPYKMPKHPGVIKSFVVNLKSQDALKSCACAICRLSLNVA